MASNIKFMEQMIVLNVLIRKNVPQNPKEKSKIDANQQSMKSKKTYYSKWGQKIYSGRGSNAEGNFRILLESRNFRGIKNRGTKRVNDELTQYAITHNIKKIHKHTTVNVLKTILNLIKQNIET